MSSSSPRLDTGREEPRKLGESINRYLTNCYGARPTVTDTGFIKPTLCEWAHLVVEPSDSDSSHGKVFLGPQQAAGRSKLAALGEASPPVAAIVNCTNVFPNHHEQDGSGGIAYCRIAVNDESGANILGYLEGAVKFMHHFILRGKSVLIHCQMGVSRSATVVMAYLMTHRSMSREEAYVHVKERRHMVNPNHGFWKQLGIYGQCLERERKGASGGAAAVVKKVVVFDKAWAERSLATYQTIGHITDDPVDLFREISTDCHMTDILLLALDFVFGRGVLEVDLPWLSALCASLRVLGVDPEPMVDEIFAEGSNFMEMWSGEVYPGRIGKIIEAVGAASA